MRPQNDVEWRLIHYSSYAYASVAGLALAVLLGWARAYGLLLLGAAAAIAFLVQSVLKKLARETRRNAQLTGAIALTSGHQSPRVAHTCRILECMRPLEIALSAYMPEGGTYAPPMRLWPT
ncbi:MAG: hypothetical protein ABSF14_22025 [Terriglobia bacterium]